ncbi:glycoside hydrolase family 3 protein [Streptomyces sp. WAC05374]|uniref:glycoside hydrolase family 3 protein n=1 Tax=Streptomyces sp. WAC05374 TaxID=2487420 RepID=UPI000F86B02E|nr:glycoside hydrolase family 3 protein [Streptomyces sp. WAC05374]RST18431.1 glycoside hydrolase family 3 protein [Streptomyces sp. WAC05374]TDF42972.1 glycoside hydrolase family 3 protein [Streptomyces sp. WAC05374]TDF46718.1 glycoside hydrolase family 3 protein [Streptomyces sp. WAC05374]TDF48913.1 glycoside hydrolase family 3 protein [Streptomyces sp. WAC05374]
MTTLVRDTSSGSLTRDALAVLQPGFTGTTAPDWLLRRIGEGLMSVGLFGRNISTPGQLAALTARLRAERDDVLVAIDEEGGDVTRLEVHTGSSFPGNLALGAVDDTGLTRAVAAELGRRLAACGVDFNWAPSADVNSDPDNPVIGVRSFGADPELVARHTVAYVEGLQDAGVAACTKHFPGHGDTNVDSHLAMPRVDVDLDTLHARELVPFRAAIAAGSKSVMSAHILLPALDPDRPATLSPQILTGLLRQELGFEGLIVTDGMEMQAIASTYGIERGSVLAIAAGADALCVGGGLADEETVLRLRDALVDAVRTGELSEERLADAAARVRALVSWTQAHRARGAQAEPGAASEEGTAPGTGIGLVAARRALRVTGAREPFTGPAHVAAFTPVANIAVGDETPWGVGPELARLLPGTTTGAYASDTAVERVLRDAGERRIVAVVRDAHRHPWMAGALDALLAVRPDTAVVEMGVNQAPPRGAPHIATHGAARVCGVAAAEVLAGA